MSDTCRLRGRCGVFTIGLCFVRANHRPSFFFVWILAFMKTESGQAFVVDDETNMRESLAELIAGEGFRVAQAGDGQEAIEYLRRGAITPDVVFLDVRTPRMDGLEVLREIQNEQLTTAPVIIISAYDDSSKMIEAMRLGAYDYI